MTLELFDNTKVEEARTCLRKYFYKHVRGWSIEGKAPPLVFGGAFHNAMDVIWRRYSELYESKNSRQAVVEEAYQAFLTEWVAQGFAHPDDLGPDELDQLGARTPMTALEMLHEYPDARENLFRDPSFKLVAIEQPFIVPLDPENDKTYYCGRFDKVFEYQGSIQICEHKTSTESTGSAKTGYKFKSVYIDSWSVNSQVYGYCFASRQIYGDKAAGVWVDACLVHKTCHDLIRFIPVEVKGEILDQWLWNLMTWIDTIQMNRSIVADRSSGPYLAAFPQNTHACRDYQSLCMYSDICRTFANPAKLTEPPMGYKEEFWSPFRILDLEKIGITPEMAGEKINT